MNTELELCSEKVRERANGPKFIGSVEDCEEILKKNGNFFCHFHFPNSNGEITVYGQLTSQGQNQVISSAKYYTNVQGAPLAFIDALVELSHKRDSHSLPLLRLREIESFLRNNNAIPSFPDDGMKLYRYYELLSALQHSITRKSGPSIQTNSSFDDNDKKSPTLAEYRPHSTLLFDREKLGSFLDLNSDLKIQIVNDIFSCHVRPLLQRDGGDVECIHVMENLVVVNFHGNCGACGMSLTTTMDFIKKVLRTELYDTNLDLITDS